MMWRKMASCTTHSKDMHDMNSGMNSPNNVHLAGGEVDTFDVVIAD